MERNGERNLLCREEMWLQVTVCLRRGGEEEEAAVYGDSCLPPGGWAASAHALSVRERRRRISLEARMHIHIIHSQPRAMLYCISHSLGWPDYLREEVHSSERREERREKAEREEEAACLSFTVSSFLFSAFWLSAMFVLRRRILRRLAHLLECICTSMREEEEEVENICDICTCLSSCKAT